MSTTDRVIQSFKSLTDEPLKALKAAIENDDQMVDKWYRQLMAEQQQLMLESKSISVGALGPSIETLLGQEEEIQRVKDVLNMLSKASHNTSLILHGVTKIDTALSGTRCLQFSRLRCMAANRGAAEILTQLLEWLFPNGKDAPSDSKHRRLRSAIVTKQAPHTAGRWLLERPDYKDWVDHPQSLLWLYGECTW